MNKVSITGVLMLSVTITLCGLPQMVQAQTANQQQPTAATQAPEAGSQPQAESGQNSNQQPGIINPSQAPLAPVPSSSQELPNAPSSTSPAAKTTPQEQQQRVQQPLGTAAAQAGITAGGAASKPAGNAIAPAKQRQVRSFLIKLGAVAAAGVAIGTVVALSKGSSSKPPGAQ